ncbi:MAG: complex I NDUFA9 subunit family protein [Alphaproteobacteria bacterium]|nr:complex I NDUFA9 subunit family protein [Alphaproteobacteria bacterium]
MKGKLVTVFGGTGFIGRHVVQRLAAAGARVRVAVRYPGEAAYLQPMGDVAQIVPVRASVTHEGLVQATVAGADAVVNLVGILYEKGRSRFDAVHRDGAGIVARAAKDAGAAALVHLSALGADPDSRARYAASKAAGEAAVRAAFPEAVILRPSVVFGPQDGFFNLFASLARFTPVLPVFGCKRPRDRDGKFDICGDGGVKFQPVYVGDVADAVMKGLGDRSCAGKTYELGGPAVYSFKEIMEMILRETGRKRLLVPVPYFLATLQAMFLQLMPKPLLTTDQVRLLKTDNVVSGELPGLAELGIEPTGVEGIIPAYLDRYRPGGRFRKPLLV